MRSEVKLLDEYLIEDVLRPGLHVVFCGTALGRVSLARRAYYANPRNLFWDTLYKTGLTPVRLAASDYALAPDFGIGLTDLGKTVSGNDNELPKGSLDVEALKSKIDLYQPRILAFTSKKAGQTFLRRNVVYGWQESPFPRTGIYVLPSTSPSARWNWQANEHHWRTLSAAVLACR